ncbi:MAG: 23S rRNA (pseudouridine(1915)-N(3))-methyltransferase RlmH [Gammaproteobacteria bacterium]|nr:23S rRNA (pseudouridine(1915)-N(3))-methyltransferase RlmH [Gammaproteobacteria bacterium]
MRIHLLAVGEKMPVWVSQGYQEYVRRLPADNTLLLHEVSAARRGKNPEVERWKHQEGERLLAAVPKGAHVVALDEHGEGWTTRQLAGRLEEWRRQGSDIALLVGGADGLSADCLQQARQRWSLSPLTLPHALVRIVLAEQLYRAWTVLQGHPYHRD